MLIKSIKVSNFQLFKSTSINLDKVNIISGLNLDNPNNSGNGSGKSTIVLRAILFALYGHVEEGLTLKDLIRFNEKEACVEIEIEKDNKIYKIIRKIPSELRVYSDDNEIQANTSTIKQKFIDEVFGDVNFFRSYRCVDIKNGINILDMGIVSVRKTLMGFIEGIFSEIRTRLLAQKVERERYSIDKKLYKHYLSEKRLVILNGALDIIKRDYERFEKDKDIQQGIISQIKSEISSREKFIYNRKRELEEAQKSGICPILKTKCVQITKQITPEQKEKMSHEIEQLYQEIEQYKQQLESEQESIGYYDDTLEMLRRKERIALNWLSNLKSAYQFKDYKYTKADIVIYDEAIKVLDTFAGEYIKEWLGSLSIILNNLLNKLNIRVEFTADKSFLLVEDNNQILKFDQLSQGQKCFLNVVFKLAILLQQEKSGIILMDDGLGSIDFINLTNLITICQTLPFQIIAIYQNYINEIEDVKQINIIRKNNESTIQK